MAFIFPMENQLLSIMRQNIGTLCHKGTGTVKRTSGAQPQLVGGSVYGDRTYGLLPIDWIVTLPPKEQAAVFAVPNVKERFDLYVIHLECLSGGEHSDVAVKVHYAVIRNGTRKKMIHRYSTACNYGGKKKHKNRARPERRTTFGRLHRISATDGTGTFFELPWETVGCIVAKFGGILRFYGAE